MNKFRGGRFKYSVNEGFFDEWTSQMAYVLGFTYADGNIYKNVLAWDVQKRDRDILEKINKASDSNYPIKLRRKRSCRLRISNQTLISGAIRLGLFPKKNMRHQLPKIPKVYLRHFVRGFLEGDGWVVLRNHRNEVDAGFASGNKLFLESLSKVISSSLGVSQRRVRRKMKITPKGIKAVTYQLEYYSSEAIRIARWLYKDLINDDIYLARKYEKYLNANRLYEFLESGTRKVRVIQRKLGRSMKETLKDLYLKQKFDGVKIAKILGVHPSSSYRWLARFGIKYPVHRKALYG